LALDAGGGVKSRRLIGLFLVVPAVVFLLVFYVLPLGYMVEESLHPWKGEGGDESVLSLEQYGKIARGGRTVRVLERTVRVSAVSTAITLALAYPVALLLLWAGRRTRTWVLVAVFLSLASSLIVRNYGWLVTLAEAGPLNKLAVAIGLIEAPLRLTFSETAIVIALVHYCLPFMILPIYASLLRIPDSLTEAAQSLGANHARAVAGVLVPLSMPGIYGGTMLTFAICMSAFVTPLLLGSPANSMISQVAAEQFLVQLNFPYGSAIIVALTVLTFAIVAIYTLLVRRVFRLHV
jgi:putative spermidine/putrescine transport system permease protein